LPSNSKIIPICSNLIQIKTLFPQSAHKTLILRDKIWQIFENTAKKCGRREFQILWQFRDSLNLFCLQKYFNVWDVETKMKRANRHKLQFSIRHLANILLCL
jgi:hypothetical protein